MIALLREAIPKKERGNTMIYLNSDRTEFIDAYVQDEDGRTVDYAAAVELMDDDLREQLHMEMAPCTNQEFYSAYVKAHATKCNGEKFQI